ncbi:Hypothetical protein, putative [Bodo saltans]|uniref:C3H1-type domain-containing protein n=1 Tax=Bodo saltans TaxID=75058 RepID=A0A0S4JCX9_BODSA|nr:Hypothetical protein, putative [Bodo saltans]|eukprot:CUG88264.1 Hypothetical protein, putative [Bodo saltans]
MSHEVAGFAQLDLSDVQPATLSAEMLMPSSVLSDHATPAHASHILTRSMNTTMSSSASLMSTSVQYVSMPNRAMGGAPSQKIAMPDGDIFFGDAGSITPSQATNLQPQVAYIQHTGQSGTTSFVTLTELPPGAIVYMAAPPPLSQTSESIGPHSRTPDHPRDWITQYPPPRTSAAPLTSSTTSGLMMSSPSLLMSHSPMNHVQPTPTSMPLPPPPQIPNPSAAVHVNFEENFNVLSEDKKTMLSIPREVIEPTIGSGKYVQQGSSACYTFRFQLCRGYQQGRCVHRHQCAFIHSRHINNRLLAGLVTYTQVHRNAPVASLTQALYPRHPEGMLLQVYDAAQAKNVQVESSHIYVTHGSLAGYRAALMDASGEGGLATSLSATQLGSDNGLVSSSVRLQFCLHFDKSLCARGETCNFVHRVDLTQQQQTSQQATELLSSLLLEHLRPLHTPTHSLSLTQVSGGEAYPLSSPTPPYPTQSSSHLSSSTPLRPPYFAPSAQPVQYFPLHSSVPPMAPQAFVQQAPESQQQFLRYSTVADHGLQQPWMTTSAPQSYAMPVYLQQPMVPAQASSSPSPLLQPSTNYF